VRANVNRCASTVPAENRHKGDAEPSLFLAVGYADRRLALHASKPGEERTCESVSWGPLAGPYLCLNPAEPRMRATMVEKVGASRPVQHQSQRHLSRQAGENR
jgi:hypothetical protein